MPETLVRPIAEPTPASSLISVTMSPEPAARFQAALEATAAKLGRTRNAAMAEHVRWLNWGACQLAGEVGIAPPAPAKPAKPVLTPEQLRYDARGYKRAKATMPGHREGIPPKSKGRKYPADPPMIAETVALLQACDDTPHGRRLRAFIVLSWRSALRVSETLALVESDLNPDTGAIVVRNGKGSKRRTVGMDAWAWKEISPWLEERREHPAGEIFCVLDGPTAGRAWSSTSVRKDLRKLAKAAGVRRRIAPHQFRHAWVLERLRENTPLPIIQRQLGHSNLAVTSHYVAGLSVDEVLAYSHDRKPPTLAVPDLMGLLRA